MGYYRIGAACPACNVDALPWKSVFCVAYVLIYILFSQPAKKMVGKKRQVVNTSGAWNVKAPRIAPLVATTQRRPARPKTTRRRRPDVERPSSSRRRVQRTVDPVHEEATTGRDEQLETLSRPEQMDWKTIALHLLEQSRQPEETSAPAPAAPLPRPFYSGGTLENPNKFLEDFEAFYTDEKFQQARGSPSVFQARRRVLVRHQ